MASLVWFGIPADNVERARKFYRALVGWEINPFPGMKNLWHIDPGGGDDTPDDGMMVRKHPHQSITKPIVVSGAGLHPCCVTEAGIFPFDEGGGFA